MFARFPSVRFFLPALLLLFFLSSCGGLKQVSLNYLPTFPSEGVSKGTMYTSPANYTGEKRIAAFLLGSHDRIDTGTDSYTLQGKVTALFDHALKENLKRNGYAVKDGGEWNRKANEVDLLPGVTVALQLEKLDFYAFSDPVKVTGNYTIELRGFLGVPSQSKVYSEVITLERQKIGVMISSGEVSEEFSQLLSGAVDKVLLRLLRHLEE